MPTGYTADIKDGITFQQYAMDCARAFGALILMRDEPKDAPIPEKIEPSDYHQKALDKAKAELTRLESLSTEDVERLAEADWIEEEAGRKNRLNEKRELRKKYNEMLYKVSQWVPPTADHFGLHKFMREQIEGSIKFDCSEDYYIESTEKLSPTAWLQSKKEKAEHDIEYHTTENNKEIERANERNAWLDALKDSLKGETP